MIIDENPNLKSRDICKVECDKCGNKLNVKYYNAKRNIDKNGQYVCRKCANAARWNDIQYRERQKLGVKKWAEKHDFSGAMKELWENDEYRDKMVKKRREISDRAGYRERMRDSSKKLWATKAYRQMMLEKFSTEEHRKKLALAKEGQSGRVSNLDKVLYSILDDLNIEYVPQKAVGYYSFDCLLVDTHTLIECQGDYWHSLSEKISMDKSKATYIEKYFSQYCIKYLWEHEFSCRDKLVESIKYWAGLTEIETVDFNFGDVAIFKIKSAEAYEILGKYHYIGTVRSHSKHYGAFLNNRLIAVASFGPITRNESASRLGLNRKELIEFTRLCIDPRYQKKNFATWFVSRCLKMLRSDFTSAKRVIAFADTTFNHSGTIYRAGNWECDGEVAPSYWYVDSDGYVMHKKTLYNRAVKLQMKEKEFAEKFGYSMVKGKKKLRFLYSLIKSN